MNILFVCALPVEIKSLKEQLKGLIFPGIKISYLLSGVGNYEAMYTLQQYVSIHKVDFIVNIGVCGMNKDMRNIPKLVQIYRIKNLSNERESLVPLYFTFAPLVSVGSSEKIVTTNEELKGEEFVDMESYGIDFVATKMNIPYIIFKRPFDRVSLSSREVDKKYLQEAFKDKNYTKLIESISQFLGKNKKEDPLSFEKYFAHFRCTFSEKEILKKAYKKYSVLHGDFGLFFEQNKEKTKKEFFRLLQDF